jgi:5-methylcytosine-specific restriction endonuclease McrA
MDRLQILDRDHWMCLMPVCLHPCTRAINPVLSVTDSWWAPTVDHIMARCLGGRNVSWNLRAAHQLCSSNGGSYVRSGRMILHEPAAVLGGPVLIR